MITDSYSKMVSENEMPPAFGCGDGGEGGGDVILGADIEEEIELMLREQEKWLQESSDERENSISRSGSAPPIFDGGNGGFGGGVGNVRDFRNSSEEEMRSDPAYMAYYYSNVNMNPRLPPPLRSKEDWRLAQRVGGGNGGGEYGGIGDRRRGVWGGGNGGGGEERGGDGSLFGMQAGGFRGANEEIPKDWRQESIEGMIQVEKKIKNLDF